MDYLTTANVLLWVVLTIAFYFVFLSHWLVAVSLYPDYVAKCQQQYDRPVVTTLVGLLLTVVPITIGLVIASATPPALMEIARFLTGWTVRERAKSRFAVGKVEFRPDLHDDGPKTLLGRWKFALDFSNRAIKGTSFFPEKLVRAAGGAPSCAAIQTLEDFGPGVPLS